MAEKIREPRTNAHAAITAKNPPTIAITIPTPLTRQLNQ
jgi:hypothetical protein